MILSGDKMLYMWLVNNMFCKPQILPWCARRIYSITTSLLFTCCHVIGNYVYVEVVTVHFSDNSSNSHAIHDIRNTTKKKQIPPPPRKQISRLHWELLPQIMAMYTRVDKNKTATVEQCNVTTLYDAIFYVSEKKCHKHPFLTDAII